jgi:hypothetical protein
VGKFKRLLRKHGDWKSFEAWMRHCERESGRNMLVLDAYQSSLRLCETAEAYLQAFMMKHYMDAEYETALAVKVKRLEALHLASLVRLERVFAAYRKDMAIRRGGGL